MRGRVILAVCAAWVLLGVVWAGQTALGAALQGQPATPLATAFPAAFNQTLPWIPVTLLVIWLGGRLPISGENWRTRVPLHLVFAAACSWMANVFVVLGFWMRAGQFQGVGTLARSAALWGTVNIHVTLLVYAAVLACTLGVAYYRETRARELHLAKVEGQLARAHVQALNAQIRPHFLFNTLHTIGQLWRSGSSDAADAMVDHLGALFHKVQASTSRSEISLSEELDIVREYLTIEEARFRDRLRVNIYATPESLDCSVPPLILQPIVENAVRHGISAVSTAGIVAVNASIENGHLHLVVRDDGPGVSCQSARPGSGTGLPNTRERLAQLYGAAGSLHIQDAPGGGTQVTIEIPTAVREAPGVQG